MNLPRFEALSTTLVRVSALTWDEIGIKDARPALSAVSRTLAAHGEEEEALAGTDLDP